MRFLASSFCALVLAGVCAASIPPQRPGPHDHGVLAANTDDMPPVEESSRCPTMVAPKPMATPLPSFPKAARPTLKIKFVIGIDGKLHNLAVVKSAGSAADSKAFNALRQWRYLPATCNGVPMSAEGTVEFPGTIRRNQPMGR